MTLHEKDIKYYKTLIDNKLKHTYLDQYLKKINIEDDKIIALDTLLAHLPQSQKETYIITVMFIQIALNTHDKVTEGPELPEHTTERITKQLKVLAGDYYSGLYYLILSETQDFKMIHTLATAIKQINELKMKLYYQEYASLDEMMNIVAKIDTVLITQVADFIGDDVLHPLISDWLFLNKLVLEQNKSDGQEPLITYWLQNDNFYSQDAITQAIDDKIISLVLSIKASLKNISSRHSLLITTIKHTLDTLSVNNNRLITFMEEG